MADTTPFDLNDSIFDGIRADLNLTQDEIDLINGSSVLISLLRNFASKPGRTLDYNPSSNAYNPRTKNIGMYYTGTNFVRTLGHELGHFYDQEIQTDLTTNWSDFDDIISNEMDEAQATAMSFIIRQQILTSTGTDIGISNRIGRFLPDGTDTQAGQDAELTHLQATFGSQVSSAISLDNCWTLATEIAKDIWGKNFLTRPRGETNRWEDRLEETYEDNGKDIPIFLQDSERIFQSAELQEDGTHKFTFQDQDTNHTERTWIYESRNGDDGDNLVTGTESVTDDYLIGGAGNDIIYGDWQETDAGNDTLDGGLGEDHLYGMDGDDILDGGADADLMEGGDGFDTYYATDGDIIRDSDRDGVVYFGEGNGEVHSGEPLRGGEQTEAGSDTYIGGGRTYTWSDNGTLTVSDDTSTSTITIEDFENNALGIYLKPKDDDDDKPDSPPPQDPPQPRRGGDPLVLDLSGNGIITTGLDAGIYFDHDGDGFQELSGFINAEDALLVLDRNNDGIINDGTELFGDSTILSNGERADNGFQALREFDENNDNVIDENDSYFSQLKLFQDLNQNGKTDEGELFSLAEKKIAAINLTYENSPYVDRFGNAHRQIGSFVTEDGETFTMTDVIFRTNYTLTKAEELPVADAIAALPDAKGYGTTYDLRQAMVRDEGLVLQGLVEEFVNCAERETRLDLVDRILMVWTGQEDGELTENKKNAILDSFFGTPTNGLWSLDPNRYEQHKATVFYQLMRQTHLSSFFANVTYVKDTKTNTWLGLYKHCVPVLARMVNEDPEGSADLVQDVVQAISGLNPYSVYRRMDAYWFLRLCNSH